MSKVAGRCFQVQGKRPAQGFVAKRSGRMLLHVGPQENCKVVARHGEWKVVSHLTSTSTSMQLASADAPCRCMYGIVACTGFAISARALPFERTVRYTSLKFKPKGSEFRRIEASELSSVLRVGPIVYRKKLSFFQERHILGGHHLITSPRRRSFGPADLHCSAQGKKVTRTAAC